MMSKPVGLREFIHQIEVRQSREKMERYKKGSDKDDNDNRKNK